LSSPERRELLASLCREKQRLHEQRPRNANGDGSRLPTSEGDWDGPTP
jgi:hypothetical protein